MRYDHLSIALVLAVAGCTKTVSLKETTPVAVTAAPPIVVAEPEPPPRVEVKEDRIEVKDTIHFDFNQATIKPESFSLLDEITKVIQAHPELKKIRIEGHTDSVGGKAYNLELSKRRAAAVSKYLTDKGIDPTRLISEGYGLEQPMADNETDEGRAKNRRVAFTILERGEVAGRPASAGGGT